MFLCDLYEYQAIKIYVQWAEKQVTALKTRLQTLLELCMKTPSWTHDESVAAKPENPLLMDRLNTKFKTHHSANNNSWAYFDSLSQDQFGKRKKRQYSNQSAISPTVSQCRPTDPSTVDHLDPFLFLSMQKSVSYWTPAVHPDGLTGLDRGAEV